MRNLILMVVIQVMVYFNYLLLYYLTVLFEQVYIIGLSSVISEMFAIAFAGAMF